MERLNSMTEQEILAIPRVSHKSFRYIREALEDFRTAHGDDKWEMPDFDQRELDHIQHVLAHDKPTAYYYLVSRFHNLALDETNHPEMDVMERIYYKLSSIHVEEFATILAGKSINLADYELWPIDRPFSEGS